MSVNVLFAAGEALWSDYEAPLRTAFEAEGLDVALALDLAPEIVDYIVYAPGSALQDFSPYTKAKAVLNLWAGVEAIVGNETLTVPLCRMVDPSLTQGMVEWVTGHVLRHHLGIDAHIHARPGQWVQTAPPLAGDRCVTVLGLGALGAACALQLAQLGFRVTGWSRQPKDIAGLRCLAGDAGLQEAIDGAEIIVLLLPDTPATRNVLNDQSLGKLASGAVVINPGRGPLIDDDALIRALQSGQVRHATLDVFREEPLPREHPFWAHPGVTVTPHIASETRPASASQVIAQNVRRGQAGLPLLHVVNREIGY